MKEAIIKLAEIGSVTCLTWLLVETYKGNKYFFLDYANYINSFLKTLGG